MEQLVQYLRCPITQQLLIDPVVAADGHLYEKTAIEKWFLHNYSKSPITREYIDDTTFSIYSIKQLIEQIIKENPSVLKEDIYEPTIILKPKQKQKQKQKAASDKRKQLSLQKYSRNKKTIGQIAIKILQSQYKHIIYYNRSCKDSVDFILELRELKILNYFTLKCTNDKSVIKPNYVKKDLTIVINNKPTMTNPRVIMFNKDFFFTWFNNQ
jgi:hypothetical protein